LIDGRIDDAAAHSHKAVTLTVQVAPEGRATLRKVARARSQKAAHARLDELWVALVGPSRASLDGLIRDARESFYRDRLKFWAASPMLAEILRPPPYDPTRPAAARVAQVRGYVQFDKELRHEVGDVITDARRCLDTVVAAAGSRATTGHEGADLIDSWATRTKDALFLNVRLALDASETFADKLAGRDVVRPELLHEDPTLPG
jgi:hypothetical protein